MKSIKKDVFNYNQISHDSAQTHVTGKSEFIDDRKKYPDEVYIGLYLSPCAAGIIKEIKVEQALKVEGIVDIFTASDLKNNYWGNIIVDTPFMAKEEINYYGEVIALIAAENKEAITVARNRIELKIETQQANFCVEKALQEKKWLGDRQRIKRGDPEKFLKESLHQIKGTFKSGGQEHFYLESQAAVAYPLENDCLEIHSSSQSTTEIQHVVARALGLKEHQVECIIKRIGGGFGGKESQAAPIATYAALVAHKLKRPARIVLTKDEDMIMTGKRHAFQTDYEVGFDQDGKFQSIKVFFNSDGGAYTDLSPSILQRALFHFDNAYYIPNILIEGITVKTNKAPNTAFRGFGAPQGALVIENIIEEMAFYLNKDPLDVRLNNLYQNNHLTTPYNQKVENNILPRLVGLLVDKSKYHLRKKEIESFNTKSKFFMKNISLTPLKFGISFTTKFLNQGNALVNIYTDGTLQVTTGAIEMGQGVYSKIKSLVAESFGISVDHVRVMPSSSAKTPNTSPTAASSGFDLNGGAVLNACHTLKDRLKNLASSLFNGKKRTIKEDIEYNAELNTSNIIFDQGYVINRLNPDQKIEFSYLVKEAYLNRIHLSSQAFFKTPLVHFDSEKGEGRPFLYYTNGASVSEIQIDKFTGELKILKTDIIMDIGQSLNEGIDLGQIAGAFIQGVGWLTTEELVYNTEGQLLAHSPATYKIPSIQDIPRHFDVSLIENDTNHLNVRKSKAVGEPPFLLAFSVWTGIKEILMKQKNKRIKLDVPATSEEILTKYFEY